jgi:hypothetical protein
MTRLGNLIRKFKTDVCDQYGTRELPSEEAARGRRQAAKAKKAAAGGAHPPANPAAIASKFCRFNMETYKLHGLPDYPAAIRAYGVTENTSTKNVRYFVIFDTSDLSKTWIQGEGEHKRSEQFYPRVRKGDHVRGIARHVYRERTLFQARQALKNINLNENPSKKDSDANTLNIPLGEAEVLGPTPPEQHHHMSKDVRHKVDVLKWVTDNRDDPALKVLQFNL